MFNISEIITGLEKLTFQLISWIILVPKTIFWLLTTPIPVIDYITEQLKLDKPEFTRFMSPIFLFLMVGILPLIIQDRTNIPSLEVEGPKSATINEGHNYTAKIQNLSDWVDLRGGSYEYEVLWSIDSDPYDTLEDTDSSFTVFDVGIFSGTLPEAHESYIYFGEGDIGQHVIQVAVYSYEIAFDPPEGAELYEDESGQYYYAPDTLLTEWLTVDVHGPQDERGSTEDIFSKVGTAGNLPMSTSSEKAGNNDYDEKDLYGIGLLLLLLPLVFSVALILIERDEISLNNLKEYLYVQCALFTPVMLTFQLMITYSVLIPDEMMTGEVTMGFLLAILLVIIWFVRTEHKVYDIPSKKILGVTIGLPILFSVLFYFFIEAVVNLSIIKILGWIAVAVILIPIVLGFFGFKLKKSSSEITATPEEANP